MTIIASLPEYIIYMVPVDPLQLLSRKTHRNDVGVDICIWSRKKGVVLL